MGEGVADVAVVIVNYNAGEHLLRCLASAFASAGDASLEELFLKLTGGLSEWALSELFER